MPIVKIRETNDVKMNENEMTNEVRRKSQTWSKSEKSVRKVLLNKGWKECW